MAARVVGPWLRRLDRSRAQEAAAIAVNSKFVRARVLKAWGRDATVIPPPVDVARILTVRDWREYLTSAECAVLDSCPSGFVFGASRFVTYKRLDLVIAAGQATGSAVVVAGAGPDRDRLAGLASRATVPVKIVEAPSTALLYALYQRCLVYVFPAIEDFGIMPVEAMACGAPVIVNAAGGAGEAVRACGGGVLLGDWTASSIAEAVGRAVAIPRGRVVPEQTRRYSVEAFMSTIRDWVACHVGSAGPDVDREAAPGHADSKSLVTNQGGRHD
jgi:glycosyltransferase involved in cell wall biosynthesis